MKIPSVLLALCLSLCASPSFSAEALGPVYPVIEADLLALMKQHAAEESANSASRLNQQKDRLKQWAKEPIGQTLSEATEVKRYRFESSLEAKSFLGENFRREWLFIDASRPRHLDLAQAFYQDKKGVRRVVLVSGSVDKAQKKLQQRVWFDQGGTPLQGEITMDDTVIYTMTFIQFTSEEPSNGTTSAEDLGGD